MCLNSGGTGSGTKTSFVISPMGTRVLTGCKIGIKNLIKKINLGVA